MPAAAAPTTPAWELGLQQSPAGSMCTLARYVAARGMSGLKNTWGTSAVTPDVQPDSYPVLQAMAQLCCGSMHKLCV